MVRGLDRFKEHFKGLEDRYVLIGGTACDLAFERAGVAFRATKDLDIVLCVELLDGTFARRFWEFVELGGYQLQEASSGEKRFYRFSKPSAADFPAMLELFARAPDALSGVAGPLTPIPISDEVSSLSAILLDSEYYGWIQAGKQVLEGLTVLRPEYLIPLKARAWIDLRQRAAAGEKIDRKDIRKHKNDAFRLVAIIDPALSLELPGAMMHDMRQFVTAVASEPTDLKSIGLATTELGALLDALRRVFRLGASGIDLP